MLVTKGENNILQALEGKTDGLIIREIRKVVKTNGNEFRKNLQSLKGKRLIDVRIFKDKIRKRRIKLVKLRRG